ISCGVRTFTTGFAASELGDRLEALAHDLYRTVPAGVGWGGAMKLTVPRLDEVLAGGARWAVGNGWGGPEGPLRIEGRGSEGGGDPSRVSRRAKERQLQEMGSLGSGNHYLELQEVETIFDEKAARAFRIQEGELLVSIHCGSRGLGHQIGTEFLWSFQAAAGRHGISLPDRELACAPIHSAEGKDYLAAMRAGIHCALANR